MERSRPGLRQRSMTLRSLLPNLVTLLALCVGLTAIRFGIEGRFESATAMIVLAAVLDGLDGRLARMLQSTSKMGAELDSLADLINFGVAPAVTIYMWSLDGIGGLGWTAAMFFVVCCAMRLARFNIMSRDPDRPVEAEQFFVGVPAPAGALLALLPLFASHAGWQGVGGWPVPIGIYLMVVAVMMISRVPTWSAKRVRIAREQLVPFLVIASVTAAVLVTYPWSVAVALVVAYLLSIPLALRSSRIEVPEAEAAEAEGTDTVSPEFDGDLGNSDDDDRVPASYRSH